MATPAPRIEVGDRVSHEGREGYVCHVYTSGICWVDFIVRGGVSAPMAQLKLIEKATYNPPRYQGDGERGSH